jgi:hypothetical protein
VFQPPAFNPPPMPQPPMFVTVWNCSRCRAELGRGNIKPVLDTCPSCGCRLIGGGGAGGAFFQQQQPAPNPPAVPAGGQANVNLVNPANPFMPANIQQPNAATASTSAGTIIACVIGVLLFIAAIVGVTMFAIKISVPRKWEPSRR